MVRETDVFDGNDARATDGAVRDDNIQCSAESMSWPSVVQHQSITVDQQAQLISVVIIIAIKPDVEIADNVDQLLEDCDSIENDGLLLDELRRHSGRTRAVDDDHGCGELTGNSSETKHLERSRSIGVDEW